MIGQIDYPNMLLKYEHQPNRAYGISPIAIILMLRAAARKIFSEQR
jgi:hypothetical protein